MRDINKEMLRPLLLLLVIFLVTVTHSEVFNDAYFAVEVNVEVTGEVNRFKVRGNMECSNRYV